jgi:hypothetical protein
MKSFVACVLSVLSFIGASSFVAGATAADTQMSVPIPSPAATSETAAENVDESFSKAQAEYHAKHYTEALKLLAQAQSGIFKKREDLYRELLPPAPKGWQEETGQEYPAAFSRYQFISGFFSVERKYVSNGHTVTLKFVVRQIDNIQDNVPQNIHITIHRNTPSASPVESVKNYDATYLEQKNGHGDVISHKLTVTVENITVEFSSPTLNKDVLMPFAYLVDYDKLRALGHEH